MKRLPENRFDTNFIHNAIIPALDFVTAEFNAAQSNGKCIALVTTSEGKFYSNGLDIDHALSTQGFMKNTYLHLLSRFLSLPFPTVAAINGHCFAGGMMLALAHDYRIQGRTRGYMCMNEVAIGLPLLPGMSALLRQKLTPLVYRKAVLEGTRFTGDQALADGLVDAVADEDVLTCAVERAAKLAEIGAKGVWGALRTEMYGETLRLLEEGDDDLASRAKM